MSTDINAVIEVYDEVNKKWISRPCNYLNGSNALIELFNEYEMKYFKDIVNIEPYELRENNDCSEEIKKLLTKPSKNFLDIKGEILYFTFDQFKQLFEILIKEYYSKENYKKIQNNILSLIAPNNNIEETSSVMQNLDDTYNTLKYMLLDMMTIYSDITHLYVEKHSDSDSTLISEQNLTDDYVAVAKAMSEKDGCIHDNAKYYEKMKGKFKDWNEIQKYTKDKNLEEINGETYGKTVYVSKKDNVRVEFWSPVYRYKKAELDKVRIIFYKD